MERSFELENITLREYISLANRFDLPDKLVKGFPENSYFRLLTQVAYNSFTSLLDSLNEPGLQLAPWFPRGLLSRSVTYVRMKRDYGAYIYYLKQVSHDQDQFSVSPRYGKRSPPDVLDYIKENGLWVLRRVIIRPENLKKYNLTFGIDIFSTSIYMVAAIHDKPVGYPTLAGRFS